VLCPRGSDFNTGIMTDRVNSESLFMYWYSPERNLMLSAASSVQASSKLTQLNSLSLATRRINCVQCSLLEAQVSNYRNALWKSFTLVSVSFAIFRRLRTRNPMTPQLPQKISPTHTDYQPNSTNVFMLY